MSSPGRWDVIVVGGGSAGCVLAARLSENPARSILLLESGPDFASPGSFPDILLGRNDEPLEDEYTWSYEAELTRGRFDHVYRGRVIGGSSSVNGGVFLRGTPDDFQKWDCPEWAWDHVLRCYRRSETDHDFEGPLHGSSGPVPVRRTPRAEWTPLFEAFYRACTGIGQSEAPDLNDPEQIGVGPIPRNYSSGIRINAAIAYLGAARSRHNLAIRGNSTVTRIVFEGSRVIGVDVAGDDKTYRVEADLIVLSAGALATPLLLMRSGIGPEAVLQRAGIPIVQAMSGVGSGLKDHAIVKIVLRPRDDRAFPKPTEPGRFQSLLVYNARLSPFRRDMHVMPAYFPDSIVLAPSLVFGQSVGNLELLSHDASVPPRIRYHYLTDALDRERLREAVQLSVELAATKAMTEVAHERLTPTDDDIRSTRSLDNWLVRNVISGYHSSGTCRMGSPQSSDSVVDQSCRVHGISGLAIADLSIMPDTVRANTNATAIMIGERAAELLI